MARIKNFYEKTKKREYKNPFSEPLFLKFEINEEEIRDGTVTFRYIPGKEVARADGELGKGTVATLVDAITHFAVIAFQGKTDWTLSVQCESIYMKPIRAGCKLVLKGTVHKIGATISFTKAEIRDESTGELLAYGKQTIGLVVKAPQGTAHKAKL